MQTTSSNIAIYYVFYGSSNILLQMVSSYGIITNYVKTLLRVTTGIKNCALQQVLKIAQLLQITIYQFHRFTGCNLHNHENILVSLKLLKKSLKKIRNFFYENRLNFTHFCKFSSLTFVISLPNMYKLSLH